jgi:hypothetical protein
MGIIERISRLVGGKDPTVDTDSHRIDATTAGRNPDPIIGGEYGGGIPPNYLPTGVNEGRPKK